MKTTNFFRPVLIWLLVFPFSFIYANNEGNRTTASHLITEKDTLPCLEIKCKLSKMAARSKNTYTVELIRYNTVEETVLVKGGGSFNFFLKQDAWYAIRVLESDCVPKLISVYTKTPDNTEDTYLYELSFVLDELISNSESRELDLDALDFPVALFSYDHKLKMFNFNEEYTNNIRKEVFGPLVGQGR